MNETKRVYKKVAACKMLNCCWVVNDYATDKVLEEARTHAKETGHRVIYEELHATTFERKENE